jgi:hypothetical protein
MLTMKDCFDFMAIRKGIVNQIRVVQRNYSGCLPPERSHSSTGASARQTIPLARSADVEGTKAVNRIPHNALYDLSLALSASATGYFPATELGISTY